MSNKVVGTTNLAIRKVIKDLEDVGDGFFIVRATDGSIMGIGENGDIYWTHNNPGAWEKCKRDGNLLYFKHGVASYGEGYDE
jgi:hypothetical protein